MQKRLRLLSPQQQENQSIVLYLSPQALTPVPKSNKKKRRKTMKNEWMALLEEQARKGYVTSLVIDEAHSVRLNQSFRPEFDAAVKAIASLYNLMDEDCKCPRIAMSATYRQVDQCHISSLLGCSPDFVLWARDPPRRISFDVIA